MNIQGYHPNVSGNRIRSDKRALKYVSKECPLDQLVQFNMDITAETLAREGHRKILGKRLCDKELSLIEAVAEDNSLLFGYKKTKADLE